MSHTKGKWQADRWDGLIYGRLSDRAHKGLHHAVFVEGEDLMICPTGLPDDPESEANAKLIAAAPELLEALENTLQFAEACHRQCDDDMMRQAIGHDIIKAKAAIAKAKS